MKNRLLIACVSVLIIVVLAALIFIFASNLSVTGGSITELEDETSDNLSEYSFTKAICDDDNTCVDYKITCNGPNLISSVPITGAVTFEDNWEDPRTEEDKKRGCG